MALLLAASPLVTDLVVFLGGPAVLGAVSIIGQNWEDIKKYLSSGTASMLSIAGTMTATSGADCDKRWWFQEC